MSGPGGVPSGNAEARAVERIEQALGKLGADLHPPAGWEARVLAGRKVPRPWWVWSLPAVALAAAAVLLLWLRRPPPSMQLAFEIRHLSGEPAMRSGAETVHLEDSFTVAVTGRQHRALWLYLNDQLLIACPGDATCQVEPAALRATWRPTTVGKYVVVAVTSEQVVPAPTGALDADLAAALSARGEVQERRFEVR